MNSHHICNSSPQKKKNVTHHLICVGNICWLEGSRELQREFCEQMVRYGDPENIDADGAASPACILTSAS